jgi:hypothetical protein
LTERREQVFGGVPTWLLADYLVDLGGKAAGDKTAVEAKGWSARLRPVPAALDGLGIGRVTVTIEGPESARVMEELRRKAQRGGG